MSGSQKQTALIIDFGSQYTQLIARRVRELGFFSKVVSADSAWKEVESNPPSVILLSGGPASVYDEGAPSLPKSFYEFQSKEKIPLLGICYGMQLIAKDLGGEVKRAAQGEYGRMPVIPDPTFKLFGRFTQSFQAWMSHGDEIHRLPAGFFPSGKSASGALASMENPNAKIYGLQFHSEVTHTEGGTEILKHFLEKVAGLSPDWSMENAFEDIVAGIKAKIGPKDHAICALSGGVDSAVAALLVHRAIGDRLHCVFVDHGLLRFQERERVMDLFERRLSLPVRCMDESERFLSRLKGVTDPEQKRKIIGAEFIAAFEKASDILVKEDSKLKGERPKFLIQGTLYPDVIESSPAPGSGKKKHSTTIKSHHNVGGLPENLRFELCEPLRDLFKDEVRAIGRLIGVPNEFLSRHPFPGPGLAVRIVGDITKERLDVLARVDEIFIQMLREEGLYDQIWQAFAVFLPIRSVGVQGDGRTHDHVVALRAVTSIDGMTADWFPFEPAFLSRVSARICNEVRGVNRVVYDISSKPPATIEWE